MVDETKVPEEDVFRFAENALRESGVDETVARLTAKGLLTASIRGVDSHGIRLLPHYLNELEGGRINPAPEFEFEQTTASTGTFDADHTYGIAAAMLGMRRAKQLAEDSGTGQVSIRNSSHCGSMAFFGLEAARDDMLGYATTHGTANTKTPGSNRSFFGNNPICVAAPMADEDPYCFDSAMTPITFNKVKQHRDTGELLPPNTVADADGNETRNPDAAQQLLPIGGYKGFGLSMTNDIVNGLLSGMPVGRSISSMFGDPLSERRNLGHFMAAVRIDAFVDPKEFKSRLQQLAEDVRSEPRADPDAPVMVPGDPEKKTRQRRAESGIPVPSHDLERFEAIANELGIPSIEK